MRKGKVKMRKAVVFGFGVILIITSLWLANDFASILWPETLLCVAISGLMLTGLAVITGCGMWRRSPQGDGTLHRDNAQHGFPRHGLPRSGLTGTSSFREWVEQTVFPKQAGGPSSPDITRDGYSLRNALEAISDGIFMLDNKMDFTYYNRRFLEMLGEDVQNPQIHIGMPLRDVMAYLASKGGAVQDEDALKGLQDRIAAYRDIENYSYEYTSPTGRILEYRKTPLIDGGAVISMNDITDRKINEQKLRNQNQWLDLANRTSTAIANAETVNDAVQGCLDEICGYIGWPMGHAYIVEKDEEGELLRSLGVWHVENIDAFRPLLDMTETTIKRSGEGVAGRSLATKSLQFSRLSDRDDLWSSPRAALSFELGVNCGVGFPILVDNQVVAVLEFFSTDEFELLDRQVQVIQSVCNQIGGLVVRKRAEQASREKDAFLRDAVEHLTEGFIAFDANDTISICNERCRELYPEIAHLLVPGTHYSEFEGTKVELADDQNEAEFYRKRQERHRRADGSGLMHRTKNGRWVLARDIKMSDGGIVGIRTDVSDFKRQEENLKRSLKLIHESVNYASQIQRSVLPKAKDLNRIFDDHFVIWEPRDTVGGDIVWMRETANGHLVAVADGTGHGIPGAFVTMIGTGALENAVLENPDGDPGRILSLMNMFVKDLLGQHGPGEGSDDGLDLGVIHINHKKTEVQFAGASQSLFHVPIEGDVVQYKGDRTSIGYRHILPSTTFKTHKLTSTPGDRFYLWTDGFTDQIGGERNRSLGKRRALEILQQNPASSMVDQAKATVDAFARYQGDQTRRDDVTILGFRLKPKD